MNKPNFFKYLNGFEIKCITIDQVDQAQPLYS